jgi:hypothetical protein
MDSVTSKPAWKMKLKILKKEVQAVLLDIQKICFNRENPLNASFRSQPVIIQPGCTPGTGQTVDLPPPSTTPG